MDDQASVLRQALTQGLLRMQDTTNMRGQQAAAVRETAPAVTSALLGAHDLTGIFVADVSPTDSGMVYE